MRHVLSIIYAVSFAKEATRSRLGLAKQILADCQGGRGLRLCGSGLRGMHKSRSERLAGAGLGGWPGRCAGGAEPGRAGPGLDRVLQCTSLHCMAG